MNSPHCRQGISSPYYESGNEDLTFSTDPEFSDDVFIPPPIPRDAVIQSKSFHPVEGNAFINEKVCQKSNIIHDSANWEDSEPDSRGRSIDEEAQRDETGEIRNGNLLSDTLVEKFRDSSETFEASEKNTNTRPCSYADKTKFCMTNAKNITENERSEDANCILPPKPARSSDFIGRDRHKRPHEVGSKVTLPQNYAGAPRIHGLPDCQKNFIAEHKKYNLSKEIPSLQRNLDHLSKSQKTRAAPKCGDRVPSVTERKKSLLEEEGIRTRPGEIRQTSTNRFQEDEKSSGVYTTAQSIGAPQGIQIFFCNEKGASNTSRVNLHRIQRTSQNDSGKEEILGKKSPLKGNYLCHDTSFYRPHTSSASVKPLLADVAQAESNFDQHRNLLTGTNLASDTPAHHLRMVKIYPANAFQGTNYENWEKNKEANELESEEALYLNHYTMPKYSPHKTTSLLEQPNPQSYFETSRNRRDFERFPHHPKSEQPNPQSYLETSQNRRENLGSSPHHPKSLQKSKKDPPLMKIILSDPVLWEQLMYQPKLLQGLMQLPAALQEQLCRTEILQDLFSKPDILQQLLVLPEIFQDLVCQPFLFRELLNPPVFHEAFLGETDTFEQPATLLSVLLLNPNALKQLLYHREFFNSLLHQPEILHTLLQQPALLDRLFTEPLILLYRLLLAWPVLQQILQYPDIWM